MQELIKRQYASIVGRKLITDNTTIKDFNDKLIEEFKEAQFEYDCQDLDKYFHELFDVVGVIFNMCYHNEIDIKSKFEEIVIKNEQRCQKENSKQR